MLSVMRTTVTLDPDTESLVRRLMAEKGLSFKRALNDAIRAGAGDRIRAPFATRTKAMGVPTVDLDRAHRCGFPEVIYGEGKTAAVIAMIAQQLLDRGQPVLATRIDAAIAERSSG